MTVIATPGGLEQSLFTILPLRNCTGPLLACARGAGFGTASASPSSDGLAGVLGVIAAAEGVLAAPTGVSVSPGRCGRTPYFCNVARSSSCFLAADAACRSEPS